MTTTIILIAAALLVAYAAYATVQKFRGKGKSCCGGATSPLPLRAEDTNSSHYPYKYNLQIEGMMCSNCSTAVNNALIKMGDTMVNVNLQANSARVLSKSEKTREAFEKALRKTDYRVTEVAPIQ